MLLTLLLNLTYPLEELSRRLGDLQFRLRPARPTSSQVALVLIDDASLARLGRWPWSRSLLARLLRQANAMRPAAIGLDIVLSEPGPPDQDRELAQAIHDAGNVVLAARLTTSPQDRLWIEPLPEFAQAAAGIGHVQAITGPDGICRSLPVQELAATGPRWAMAVEVFRVATKTPVRAVNNGIWTGNTIFRTQGRPGGTKSSVGETFSPAIALIDFRKQIVPGQDAASFLTISAADVLEGKPISNLQGKSLFLGLSAIDASDRILTPVSDRLPMPGVELHANLLDALMGGRSLRTVSATVQFLLLVTVSLLCTCVALRWPGASGLGFTVALAVTIFGLSFLLLLRANIVLDLAPLLCATALTFPLAQVSSFIALNRGMTKGLRQLRTTLSGARFPKEIAASNSARAAWVRRDLPWKMDVLTRLQEELVSLYNFRQNLLLAMEEGVAVYAEDGTLMFSNPRWHVFCGKQQWNPDLNLEQLTIGLGIPDWAHLLAQSLPPKERFETEIQSGDSLWQLRAVRVNPGHDANAMWMLVASDMTLRLERDRARSEALGFVTHELRTPLSSIQGFAEFLMRYPESSKKPEVATTIFRESQRLVALINTYLDVLRMDAGHAALQREELNVDKLATQVHRIIEPLAETAESHVIVEVASNLPRLEGDANLIAGALLNLLNNAVKYSPAGSEIRLKVTGSCDSTTFEVSNPGPPIPVDDLEHIFDSFYRGKKEAGATRGWGLGLAFVKRIAEAHGGRVEVTSDSTATVFRFVLPRAAQLHAQGA
jgi:signal transduction histidine kinase/CHASE2 domain-containing sensor protein